MVMGAVIGGLASLASTVASGIFSKSSAKQQYNYQSQLNAQGYKYSKLLQEEQNEYNYKTFQEENAFNEQMFNRASELSASAHQIEVEDLRKAGLNPILSATGGNGANVVSPVQSAQTSSGSATQSGGSAAAFNKQFHAEQFWNGLKYDLEKKNNESQVDLNKASEELAWKNALKTDADIENILSRLKFDEAQTAMDLRMKDAQIKNINAVSDNIRNKTLIDSAQSAADLSVKGSVVRQNRSNTHYIDTKQQSTPRVHRHGINLGRFGFFGVDSYEYPKH